MLHSPAWVGVFFFSLCEKKICLESFLILLRKAKNWESRVQKRRLVQIIHISSELEGWAAPAPFLTTEAPEWAGEGQQHADRGRRKPKQRKGGFYSLSFAGDFFSLVSSRCSSPTFSSFRNVFSKIHEFLMFKE